MPMTKYIAVGWPEIQDYMDDTSYPDSVGFDPEKNIWFVPEDMYNKHNNKQ